MSGQEMSGPQLLEFIAGSQTPFAGLPVLDCGALQGTAETTPRLGAACVMSGGLLPVTDNGAGTPAFSKDFQMAGLGNVSGMGPTAPKYGLN